MAAGDDVEEVANDGPGARGDDADGFWEGGERALAFGVEEAFGFEAFLELFEGELERSGADRLHGFGDELHLSALLIDADATANEDVEAVFRAEAEEQGLTAEEDNGELRVSVLEREINVAGRGGTVVGDFAFNPDIAILLLDQLADLGDELANGPDAADGDRVVE